VIRWESPRPIQPNGNCRSQPGRGLSGRSSESFEDAVRQTVERAAQTIRNIQSVWVKEFEGVVENNRVTQFQVIVKVSFLVGEGASLVGEGASAG